MLAPCVRLFTATVLMALCSLSWAQGTWTLRNSDGVNVAITPSYQLEVRIMPRPNETVWGKIEIPIKEEQLPELHKHRKSPNFPFIDVGIEIDRYYRTAQGRIYDDRLMVSVELDLRQWEAMKKGNRLLISLPDGTEMKESLRGSLKVLRQAETSRRN